MKSSRIVQLAMFALVVFGGVETAIGANPVYSFTTIDVPGATSTAPAGINNTGQIVGDVACLPPTVSCGANTGFLLTAGGVTFINFPSELGGHGFTNANGINDGGQIVGIFPNQNFVTQSFLHVGGSYTPYAVPGANSTAANGINNSGQIVWGLLAFRVVGASWIRAAASPASMSPGPVLAPFPRRSTTTARLWGITKM